MPDPMILIEKVCKTYYLKTRPEPVRALDNVSNHIDRGEVVVVIGPSGSGKSTLLRAINGLQPVDSGRITIDGVEVTSKKTNINKLRAEVGMVFQHFNLFPHLNILQNCQLAPISVRGESKKQSAERAMELLRRVHMESHAHKYPSQLSGGQQQRAAIARALCMAPKAMLFDEPTSALDPEMVGEVLDTMRDLADGGMTMLIVTHEMGFARQVADRVVFMDAGRIIEQAPPAQFFDAPQHERSRQFLSQILH